MGLEKIMGTDSVADNIMKAGRNFNIVDAEQANIKNSQGALTGLITTDKSSVVKAINEVKSQSNETATDVIAHKAGIVQTDEVNSSTKYPSSAVTFQHGQEIDGLNRELKLITITTVQRFNQLTSANINVQSSLIDILNAMPVMSKVDNYYVESSTHYPAAPGKICSSIKTAQNGGLLVFFYDYASASPKMSYCMINSKGVQTEWKTFE